MDFNVIFIKYPSKLSLIKTITGTTRQVYSLFDEHGHLDPDYSTNTGTTSELHNQYIFFEKMTWKLHSLINNFHVMHHRPLTKKSKDIIIGDKAKTISEVLNFQPIANFPTTWSLICAEPSIKGKGAMECTSKNKNPRMSRNLLKNLANGIAKPTTKHQLPQSIQTGLALHYSRILKCRLCSRQTPNFQAINI